MDFEQLKKVVLDRHTVRVFTNEPIENGVMEEILGYSLVFSLFDATIYLWIEDSHIDEYSTL